MSHNIESIKTAIGEGIRISDGERLYEQVQCKNGLTAIISRPEFSSGYNGILCGRELKDTAEDYALFKSLTDRLIESGDNIKNSEYDYMLYTGMDGLNLKLKNGAELKINLSTRPLAVDDNRKTTSAFVTAVGGTVGLGVTASLILHSPLGIPIAVFYGLAAEFVPSFVYSFEVKNLNNPIPVGPFAQIGRYFADWYFTQPHSFQKTVEITENVKSLEGEIEKLKSIGNQRKLVKMLKELEEQRSKLINSFGNLFDDTKKYTMQKGISVSYWNASKEKIDEFFEHVLDANAISTKSTSATLPEAKKYLQQTITLDKLVVKVPADHTPIECAGKYKLTEIIGVGGFSVVYKAKDENGTDVVVKIPRKNSCTEHIQAVAKGLESLVGKDLPQRVKVVDVSYDDKPYVAMEFIEGCTLNDILNCNKTLDVSTAVEIIKQVASGLESPHRDIKPSNIFVTKDGKAKLIDFCSAQQAKLDLKSSLTAVSADDSVKGTLGYIAPEALEGEPDIKSDMFSLGQTLYASLIGDVPFGATDSMVELRKEIPEQLEAIYKKLTKKNPAERLTPNALVENLEALQQDSKLTSISPVQLQLSIEKREVTYETPAKIVEKREEEIVVEKKQARMPISEVLRQINKQDGSSEEMPECSEKDVILE